jgi:hypothetical protein
MQAVFEELAGKLGGGGMNQQGQQQQQSALCLQFADNAELRRRLGLLNF